ncbi:MAG TPA: GNAT family protein [Streptosporangiaceae bacterium]|nr:GNAT family protein [Streptosporangiaceae bacterium]
MDRLRPGLARRRLPVGLVQHSPIIPRRSASWQDRGYGRALRASEAEAGFVVCDAVSGDRLGNIALEHHGRSGEVSYWVAADGRGRGVATRALVLFSAWSFRVIGVEELRLWVHRDNVASQRVAARAGYQRDPSRDKSQETKGTDWPMLAFSLTQAAI